VIFVEIGKYYRVNRTCFLTIPAVNAFEQVDIVSGSPAGPVISLFRLNSDRKCRTHGLAKLAGDTAFFTVGVTA
jgi:hypothetical protein